MAAMAALSEHPTDLAAGEEQKGEPTPIFRLVVPGYPPITGTRDDVLVFSRFAFSSLVGRGLVATIWSGQRRGACQVFAIAPRRIAL
jgi:hypothetical protein